MNEVINRFLLAGDKFKPEIHLRQPGFTYSACDKALNDKSFNIAENPKYDG